MSAVLAASILILWQNQVINVLRLENTRLQRERPRIAPTRDVDHNPAVLEGRLPRQSVEPFNWRTVETKDYRRYIANLRTDGCPEETIRDIFVADVNALFAERAKGLRSSTNRIRELNK